MRGFFILLGSVICALGIYWTIQRGPLPEDLRPVVELDPSRVVSVAIKTEVGETRLINSETGWRVEAEGVSQPANGDLVNQLLSSIRAWRTAGQAPGPPPRDKTLSVRIEQKTADLAWVLFWPLDGSEKLVYGQSSRLHSVFTFERERLAALIQPPDHWLAAGSK